MYIASSVYIINKHNVFAILIQVSQDSFTLKFTAFDMQYSSMVKGQSKILAHTLAMGITKSQTQEKRGLYTCQDRTRVYIVFTHLDYIHLKLELF